ncbi:Crp/Fnr family transcriptional regulator [Sphingomonas gellani]|uniref:Crp/Fnr family transcriptional regulator n=1 Tax=Sphingomonas gellani TaxID=1166340 RepID=UPI0031393C35
MDLTQPERVALAALEDRPRTVRRGTPLVRANDRGTELFMLRRGMLMNFVLLDDGSRQILGFHFPGDMLGWPTLAFRSAPEALVAVTEAEVCSFDRAALIELASERPRLFAAITAFNQMERQALVDRLAGMGRTSARGRVAALLIEIRNRMRRVDATITNRFILGLTQEEIGDATGLTAVHVNRMLRQLEEDGLIAREGGRVTLIDEDRLAHVANYIDRNDAVDLTWLARLR